MGKIATEEIKWKFFFDLKTSILVVDARDETLDKPFCCFILFPRTEKGTCGLEGQLIQNQIEAQHFILLLGRWIYAFLGTILDGMIDLMSHLF